LIEGIVVLRTPPQGSLFAGRYRVGPVLGEGGMGIVLSAVDEKTNVPCALKVVSGVSSEQDAARLLREARALMLVSSTHVVRIFDVDELEGVPFLVLERLEGQDLARLSEGGVPLPPRDVATFAFEACEALTQAHAVGIIHRDIKPSNLFLARQPDGREIVKVLDFGISKAAPGDNLGAFTSSHQPLGSPQFISPEQIANPKSVDPRTDIWSLGAVMFRLLSGQYPFAGKTKLEIHQAITTGKREPLHAVAPTVPAGLAGVVERCLSHDREERYGSAAELAAALLPYTEVEPELPTAVDEEPPTREIVRVVRAPKMGRTRFVVLGLGIAIPLLGFLVIRRGAPGAPMAIPSPSIAASFPPPVEASIAAATLPSPTESGSSAPSARPVRASRPRPHPGPPSPPAREPAPRSDEPAPAPPTPMATPTSSSQLRTNPYR
jgi:serine/threonine-protein kinase